MKEDFVRWMAEVENKVPGTVSNYAWAIDLISQHYSEETGRIIDVYTIDDMDLLRRIYEAYRGGGRFYDFGNKQHGLYRAAISAYLRYFEEISVIRPKRRSDDKCETVAEDTIAVNKSNGEHVYHYQASGRSAKGSMKSGMTNKQKTDDLKRLAHQCAYNKNNNSCDNKCEICPLNVALYLDDPREAFLIRTNAELDYQNAVQAQIAYRKKEMADSIKTAIGWLVGIFVTIVVPILMIRSCIQG